MLNNPKYDLYIRHHEIQGALRAVACMKEDCSVMWQLLTVCDSSKRLIESGGVAVIREGHVHSSREQPAGKREGFFVVQQPVPEFVVVYLFAL